MNITHFGHFVNKSDESDLNIINNNKTMIHKLCQPWKNESTLAEKW